MAVVFPAPPGGDRELQTCVGGAHLPNHGRLPIGEWFYKVAAEEGAA